MKATVVIEFFLNLFVFSLPVELLLVPLLFFLLLVPVVARGNEQLAPAIRVTNFLSSTIGLVIGAYTVWKVVVEWRQVVTVGTAQSLALPVWLTLGLLPFVYVLSLWVNYGVAFT